MSNSFFIIMALIVLVFGVYPMVRLIYTGVYPYIKDSLSQDDVLKIGVTTNAEVVHILQTSSWSGNRPVYKLTFRFETKDNQVFESTIMKALTFKEIENFKEGNYTEIKYDPREPLKVAISDKSFILGE